MTTDHEAHIEAQVDAFVDKGLGNYAEARDKFGLEVPDNKEFTADAITARAGNVALTGSETYIEDELDTPEPNPWKPGDNYKYGFNDSELQAQPQAQKDLNSRNIAMLHDQGLLTTPKRVK